MQSLQASWTKISDKKLVYKCVMHYIKDDGEVKTFNKLKEHLATIKEKNDGRWGYTIKVSQFSKLWNSKKIIQGVLNTKQEAIDFVVSHWNAQLLAKLEVTP